MKKVGKNGVALQAGKPKIRIGKLSDYRPQRLNANQHTERGLRMLDDSMSEDGYVAPMTAVADGEVIDGSARLERAFDRFSDEAIILEHDGTRPIITKRIDIPDADNPIAKRIALRANRIAEADLSWNPDVLAQLAESDPKTIEGMFSDKELAEILTQTGVEPKDATVEPEKAAECQQKWQVVAGQIFTIGRHVVMCGDSSKAQDIERLCGGVKVQVIVTDPPYGMNLDASFSNSVDNPAKGIKASRGYKQIAGDDQPFDARPFLDRFSEIKEQFWWGADYYADTLPRGGSWLAWDKRASVEGVSYSSAEFELCWSRTPHHRRMLRVPWFGLIGTEQQDTKQRLAAAQKPLQVITPLIETAKAKTVLDLFAGSGTTLIAAENLGCTSYCMEVDSESVAIILERASRAFPHLKIERLDRSEAA